mgnify:CR=1 FL=1
MNRKGFTALLLAGILLTAAACGEESSTTGGVQEAMEDMPYGATMTKISNTDRPSVLYDARYISDGMLEAVLGYYTAIQTQDADRFTALQFPLYRSYQLENVLGGEFTDADILASTYSALSEYNGGDFVFSMIEITDYSTGVDNSRTDELLALLDGISADQGGDKISEDVTALCELTITRYLADADSDEHAETDTVLADEALFVMEYQSRSR